ncbi:Do family serine endopeptidase [Fluviispira multicolorata]|uniref:Do family serine endopeptidase n=1 Tax=Fluviispira multicolorata TaxID=2654512 RepID=A0A833N2I2_9BACT|nr:Do family serine endopeptidase [Fluviispira multicolorata]KAB8028117.1 Do family serine endopeptidase [Fluviispira multicolorata]
MNLDVNDSKKVSKFMKARAKNIVVASISIAALFGVASAGLLIFKPEAFRNMSDDLSAQASTNTYALPPNQAPTPSPDAEFLKKFKKVFSNVAEESSQALVFIVAEKKVNAPQYDFPDEFFFPFLPPQFKGGPNPRGNGKKQGIETDGGSGFIVDLKSGYIITNNHVIEGADKITVTTKDKKKYKAKIIGTAKNVDIAVLKLEDFKPTSELKQVNLANSNDVKVGDWVLALGAPFELEQTVTMGVVSAVQRTSDTLGINGANSFIQTDAAINPGNSGGPLVNLDGQVIGMNTAIFSKNGTSVGIGFSIPANTIRLVAESIINNGKLTQAYLGVEMYDLNKFGAAAMKEMKIEPNTEGALVMRVVPGSPAAKSGLQPYDIIQSVNGETVKASSDIQRQIIFLKPGSNIKLGILRNGKKVELKATVTELPNSKSDKNEDSETTEKSGKSLARNFGLSFSNKKSPTGKGVVVGGVQQGSLADRAGIAQGDVIVSVNKEPVSNSKDVEKILEKAKKANSSMIFLLVEREDTQSAIILPLNS